MNTTAASMLSPPTTSLHMTPEELARLDTSINNYLNTYTVPSLSHIGNAHMATDSGNIGGGLTAGRLMSSAVQQHQNIAKAPTTPMTPYSVAGLSTRPFPPTPPQTSPVAAAGDHKPHNVNVNKQNTINTTSSNIPKLYEERIEVMKRNEQERMRQLEQEHRQHIERLSGELEKYRLKADQLAGEKMACQRDLERLTAQLESVRVGSLNSGNVKPYASNTGYIGNTGGNTGGNIHSAKNTSNTQSDIRQQYEMRIADLLATFERERQASVKLQQNKVRSQLALLVPKLKQRWSARFSRHLEQLEQEHQKQLERLRLEHAQDRRALQRQAREDAELEFKEWQAKAREKMRVKVMQVKNEAERRVLERLHH